MTQLGYERVEANHGLFLCIKDGQFVFGLAVRVDGFLYGGSAGEVQRFERELMASFSVGPIALGSLAFTGLRLRCEEDADAWTLVAFVDQDHYVASIEPMDVALARAAASAATVTTLQLTLYRRAVGALLSVAAQRRGCGQEGGQRVRPGAAAAAASSK